MILRVFLMREEIINIALKTIMVKNCSFFGLGTKKRLLRYFFFEVKLSINNGVIVFT